MSFTNLKLHLTLALSAFLFSVLDYLNFYFCLKKDAIDLFQGHYIISVSRGGNSSSPEGVLEALAVSSFPMDYFVVLKSDSSKLSPLSQNYESCYECLHGSC